MNIGRATVGVAVSAVLLVGAVAGLRASDAGRSASAQVPDGTPTAERQDRRGEFLERVAGKLGIPADDLREAIQSAALDAVNEAEADGRITAEQAARARERIESGEGLRGFMQRRHERRAEIVQNARREIGQSAATALGISVEELRTELQSGDSIADIATERNVPLEDVKAQILGDAETKLGEAVANGRVTQAQADTALAKLTGRIDDILNRSKAQAQP